MYLGAQPWQFMVPTKTEAIKEEEAIGVTPCTIEIVRKQRGRSSERVQKEGRLWADI